MTLNDIYMKTKLWIFEKPSSTNYDNYIVATANKVLAEVYDENNMARMFHGKLPWTDGMMAHQVSNMSDEIDYEEEYLLDVIPKGIDANFLFDEDLARMDVYQTEYNNARVEKQVLLSKCEIDRLYEERGKLNVPDSELS